MRAPTVTGALCTAVTPDVTKAMAVTRPAATYKATPIAIVVAIASIRRPRPKIDDITGRDKGSGVSAQHQYGKILRAGAGLPVFAQFRGPESQGNYGFPSEIGSANLP